MNPQKETAKIAFKKARGQLEKILVLMDEDAYCINIMQQNLAVIGLLKSAHQTLLEQHLKHCFSEALDSNQHSKKEKMSQEILQVTKLANK